MLHYDINISRSFSRMFRFVTVLKRADDACVYMHSWLPYAPLGMHRHYICSTPELREDVVAHVYSRNMIHVHKNRVLFASYGYGDSTSLDITSFFRSTHTDMSLELISKEMLDTFIPCTASFWFAVISTPCTSLMLAWKYVTTRRPFELKIVTSDLRVFIYKDPMQTVKPW